MKSKLLTATATIALLTACATSQETATTPSFLMPAAFQSGSISEAPIQSNWLATFNDPQLNKLIDEVLAKNFDLAIASAKVDAATASAKLAGANLKPAVNLNLGGANQGNTGAGLSNDASTLGASLDVSWEADVWGRVRAGRDAAVNELKASQLDYDYAKLSLAAQTTKAYFLAIETGRQLKLAENNIANYDKTLEIVDAFFKEGMVSIQDVHLAKSEKARSDDSSQSTKSAHLEALRSLETLLGRYPSAEVDVAATLPALPAPVPVGIPSEILERRPDIVAAERRVAAAFNKVSEAQAAKLPRIALTGGLGNTSSDLSTLIQPSNLIWNVASNLMFPLFDAGKLDAQADSADATQKQALSNYQKTALKAFGDIETALSNEDLFRKRVNSLTTAYEQARSAEEIGLDKYKNGEGNLLDVQQLQRATISSQSALSKVQQDLLVQRVNLHLGLGGDF